jgi:conjugative relaxase-like TrwC/TraI family protein
VISIARLAANADTAIYYLEAIANDRDDYYVASGEVPGRWLGSGSALLGLAGEVTPEDLRAILDGLDPRTGAALVGYRKNSGFDLTLSAPKSVSLLWGLGDRATTEQVAAAHDQAVLAALAYLEDAACTVRRGKAGSAHHRAGGLVVAAFRHRTSREADPQLHTHLVTANMALGPDGRWTALHSADIWHHSRTAGFIYQSVLRHEVAERLSIAFDPEKPGIGEVVGIPKPVRRKFSRRRIQIEAAMAEHGVRTSHGAQIATLDTRPARPAPVSEDELRSAWRDHADAIGFDLSQIPRQRRHPLPPDDQAIGLHLTRRDATFDRLRVLQAVAETATQGLPFEQIMARAAAFLAGPEVVEVTATRWTTPEMLAIEADAIDRAIAGPPTAAVNRELVDAAIAARPSISREQAEAVRSITTTSASVAVLIGHAGTGKTFALDAAGEAWHNAGLRPTGVALAGRAAAELQAGSGIASQTIASFLRELDEGRRLTDRDVLVCDEAGMVGTRDLHRLLVATTRAGAKLVLVGDHKQLAEIEAGGLFAGLARGLGAAELTENRRLQVPAQAATALALRNGDVDRALLRLHRTGGLTVGENADRLRSTLAEDWFLEHNDGKHAVILALRRSDVDELNYRVRRLLHRNGQLGDRVIATHDADFCVGDRVLALRNDRRIGVMNGTQGTIAGMEEGNLLVDTHDGNRLAIPARYAAEGHLTHGYAMTVHKAQGMTCDVSLVLGDDSLYAEAGYTSITRGRFRNHVYVVASHDPDDPVAEIRRSLDRSAAKQTAIEQMGLGL